jgi:hypothetical protein
VPIASGLEARLIQAEALLATNPGGWLTAMNTIRATRITPALPALADPGTQVGREDLHFRERAFWLFGTGHRLGDLRRMIRQYNRTEDGVFPTGPAFQRWPVRRRREPAGSVHRAQQPELHGVHRPRRLIRAFTGKTRGAATGSSPCDLHASCLRLARGSR